MNRTNKSKFFGALFIIQLQSSTENLINFEQYVQDFVLEQKQIIIPAYPGAFNASIVRWHDKLLLCFRVRDANMISNFQFGCVWLDDDFNPISRPSIIEISDDSSTFIQRQDPRLIIINQKLYIIYSNFIKIDEIITRRLFVAQLHWEDDKFFIINPLCLHPFEGWSKRWEKNWVPFNYNENLLLSYSIDPHRVFRPLLDSGECITENVTASDLDWSWGELRGGTPAILDNGEYLAFFHSSKVMASMHSEGKKIQHYFIGAYTFSAQPPFVITRTSSTPIIGKNFYTSPPYPTWKPLRVVFPMGCVCDENYIWLTFGKQDFEIWVAKIDKKALLQSLVPCLPKQETNTKILFEDIDIEPEILDTYESFYEGYYC